MLNRGGKKIDLNVSNKQTTVGGHLINFNSNDPVNLEKAAVDSR